MFNYVFEECEVSIDITKHARKRMAEREIFEAPLYGAIVAVSDKVLDLKNGEEFAVLDKDLGIAIVCSIHSNSDIVISVVTVIDSTLVWIKSGTKVISAL